MTRPMLFALGAIVLTGCGKPEEQVVDVINEMADLLATVKDKDSLDESLDALKELHKETRSLKADIEMEEASKEVMADVMKATRRKRTELSRIAQETWANDPDVRKALRELGAR